MVWGIPIVLYLFLAGLGAGAYATTALAGWGREIKKVYQLASRLTALVLVGIGLVLLMADAHAGLVNPVRFFFLISNPASVMMWGVVFLSVFMIVCLIAVILVFRGRNVPKWLDGVGIAISVAVAAYTAVLLGAAGASMPLWNIVVLPPLFLVSAASTGIAADNLIAIATKTANDGFLATANKVHKWLPIVEVVLIALLLFVVSGNEAGFASVNAILKGEYALLFWIGLIVIGIVVPMVVSFTNKSEGEGSAVAGVEKVEMLIGSEVCVLVGGLALRAIIVMAATSVSMPAVCW